MGVFHTQYLKNNQHPHNNGTMNVTLSLTPCLIKGTASFAHLERQAELSTPHS